MVAQCGEQVKFANWSEVILEIADDFDPRGRRTDRNQALGVGGRLRQEARDWGEHLFPEKTELAVARKGAIGDARVDDAKGDARCCAEEIRPELRFHEDEKAGLEAPEIAAMEKCEVKREVKDGVGAEALARDLLGRPRRGGNEDAQGTRAQSGDERFCGQELSDGNGMQPNSLFAG